MEDKYKSLTGEQLAAEESFIRWVINGENSPQWSRWNQSNPDLATTIEEAKYIVRSLASFPVSALNPEEKNELWNRINDSVYNVSRKPIRRRIPLVRWTVAAAAALALLFWLTSITLTQKVQTEVAENIEFILPELSQVTLNADSRISYKKNTFDKKREIRLEGEAFFKVIKGTTFTVKTTRGDISVLGTSFNVISRLGIFEVSCYTGKVSVTKGNEEKVITAGERVSFEDNTLQQENFTPTEKAPWTQGKFTFEDQPLSIVIDELERQYDVNVTMANDLKDIRYIGLFEGGNLDTALHTITWPLTLKYEIKGKSVTISR